MSQLGSVESTQRVGQVVANAKDIVALLRDAGLLVLFVILLGFPEKLNAILVRAGLDEGTFVGFRWKAKLIDSDVSLKEASAKLTDLKAKGAEMLATLNEAARTVNDVALKARIASLNADSSALNSSVQNVQESISSTISGNSSLVQRAQGAADIQRWAVVFGGDTTLDRAQHEVRMKATRYGIPNVSIYLRQGAYRSVSVVSDQADTEGVLLKARQARPDSYLVSMASWCPRAVERNGYQECQ